MNFLHQLDFYPSQAIMLTLYSLFLQLAVLKNVKIHFHCCKSYLFDTMMNNIVQVL